MQNLRKFKQSITQFQRFQPKTPCLFENGLEWREDTGKKNHSPSKRCCCLFFLCVFCLILGPRLRISRTVLFSVVRATWIFLTISIPPGLRKPARGKRSIVAVLGRWRNPETPGGDEGKRRQCWVEGKVGSAVVLGCRLGFTGVQADVQSARGVPTVQKRGISFPIFWL